MFKEVILVKAMLAWIKRIFQHLARQSQKASWERYSTSNMAYIFTEKKGV